MRTAISDQRSTVYNEVPTALPLSFKYNLLQPTLYYYYIMKSDTIKFCPGATILSYATTYWYQYQQISSQVDSASARLGPTEVVDLGSILGLVKPKTIKIGIHSFPA